ncbi:MAG: hypothetical protein LBT47_04075 [Deltaproteobacteria bacterium]|nr:hypothetical protein [Deltaproteobacteria bacterium]
MTSSEYYWVRRPRKGPLNSPGLVNPSSGGAAFVSWSPELTGIGQGASLPDLDF